MIHTKRRRYHGKFTREDCYIERVGYNHYVHVHPDGTRNKIDVSDWIRRQWVELVYWLDVTGEMQRGI